MKVIAVLFAPSQDMSSLEWAHRTAGDDVIILNEGDCTLRSVLMAIKNECKKAAAEAAVFAYSDCPFLDDEITKRLIENHFKYSAEYTFADGYPYGFAPEVIDAGAAGILCELGDSKMSRTAIWDLIKTDINSFEVETLISPHDYRLWRLAFHNGDKRGRMACEALKKIKEELMARSKDCGKKDSDFCADTLCQAAIKDIHVVRTVPAFYEVGISGRGNEEGKTERMSFDKFALLVKQIKELSDKAVVSLSAMGEPLEHPEFIQFVETAAAAGLDVLVETDGKKATEQIASQCKNIADKHCTKIMWVIKNSAQSLLLEAEKWAQAKERSADVNAAKESEAERAVCTLAKYFMGDVYPQMVRTKETEKALEPFYRKWSAKDSPSGGKVLIQKYCSYCGTLPDEKPCDLSPLERNPCWHLRRDMVILADGSVPLCFARERALKDGILGNAFIDGLKVLWDKMEGAAKRDLDGKQDELCRKCDEYYTFNF